MLKGKLAVFVVDDESVEEISLLLKFSTVPDAGLNTQSKVIGYSTFLTAKLKSDILIIELPQHNVLVNSLTEALKGFKSDNPAAVVVIHTTQSNLIESLGPLRTSGTISCIESKMANSFYLLEKAAESLRQ